MVELKVLLSKESIYTIIGIVYYLKKSNLLIVNNKLKSVKKDTLINKIVKRFDNELSNFNKSINYNIPDIFLMNEEELSIILTSKDICICGTLTRFELIDFLYEDLNN